MSMIASILQLDRRDITALRITDPYSVHRVVYSLYPDVRSEADKAGNESSGILFADQGGDITGRRILMLSDRAPVANIEGRYGHVRSKPVPDAFLDHPSYRFNVIVNPTKRDSASRKLIPVKGRDAIRDWFCQRATDSWGFEVLPEHLDVGGVDVLRFTDKRQQVVTLAQAHVSGRLLVTDSLKFKNSFESGIGRGRAFGCGLLQIVPLASH